jgi:N-acetylmuramoyl-L-alanine amidase
MIDSLILTHTNDLARLDAALSAGRYTGVKVVTGWGLDHGWTDAERAHVATMTSTLIVRTVAGDPSYNNGQYLYPVVNDVLTELTPWFAVAPTAYYEIGNEPNIAGQSVDSHVYAYYLKETIARIRRDYPAVRLIGTGMIADATLEDWVLVLRDALALCDAAAIHAYAWRDYLDPHDTGQLQHAIDVYARQLPGLALMLTEYGINGSDVPDTTKAERDATMLSALPQVVIGASRYHATTAPLAGDQQAYAVNQTYLAAYSDAKEGTMAPPIDYSYRSGNYNARPTGMAITAIVVHTTEGSWPGDIQWLCSSSSGVSCHYVISPDGDIYSIVDDSKRAWHAGDSSYAGKSDWNSFSIGIEVSHRQGQSYGFNQIPAVTDLCQYLVARYPITRLETVMHRTIAQPPGRKSDPTDVTDAQFASWADRLFRTTDSGRYIVKAGTIGATVVSSPSAIKQMIAPGAWWDAPTARGPSMTLAGFGTSDEYVGSEQYGYIWKPLLVNRS